MNQKRTSKVLQSYVPSEKLVKRTEKLVEQHSLDELHARLVTLSRTMEREGMAFEDYASHELTANAAGASTYKNTSIDLMEIDATVQDILAHKPLQHDLLSEDGNCHLRLFDAYHPRAPMRIEKCLDATADWCAAQMDALDKRAEHLVDLAVGEQKKEAAKIAGQLQFLDETMGMLHHLKEWAATAGKEVKAAQHNKKAMPGGRGAA